MNSSFSLLRNHSEDEHTNKKRNRSLENNEHAEPLPKKQRREDSHNNTKENLTNNLCFDTLPNEIQDIIFRMLRLDDMFCCQLVSKLWNGICWRGQTALDCRSLSHHLEDRHIQYIVPKISNLQRVNFYYCSRLSGLSIETVARYCKHLSSININGCSRISSDCLDILQYTTTLKRFVLSQELTPNVRHFTQLETLLVVSPSRDEVFHSGLPYLTSLTKLKDLQLWKCFNIEMKHFVYWTKLEWLKLSASSIDDNELIHLSGLTSLTFLALNDMDNIKGFGLQYLTSLINLRSLSLNDVRVASRDVCVLSCLTALTSLEFSILWNDQQIDNLTCFRHLRRLGLDYSYCHEIFSHDFENITLFTNLKSMRLEANGVNQQIGISHLKFLDRLTNLEEFHFIAEECVIDFRQLSKYTNLRRLLFMNAT